MNRLISIEGSNPVAIRIEPGEKCSGELTLVNVMYTMPVGFRIQAAKKDRYFLKPQSGIIQPLSNQTVQITYQPNNNIVLPETFPFSNDEFELQSVVVPGASTKYDAVPPPQWFTNKKKQVFADKSIRIIFVGSPILTHLVSRGCSVDELRQVLENSQPCWRPVDSVDSFGETLLHAAIARRRPDLVQLILEFGPDLRGRSGRGLTALEAACELGEALIVELLAARGGGGWGGALRLAAGKGHAEVVRVAVERGADVDAVTGEGWTALRAAAEGGRRECVEVLVGSGAAVDVRDGEEGNTALHAAARLGDEGMVSLLLRNGANKDIRNYTGRTAYDMAAENGHVRLFDALKLGDTLCRASRKGEVKTMMRAVENGAEIKGRDQHGWTALHRACFKGKVEAVRWLLERGLGEVEAKDEEGYRAVHCAAESGQGDVMELLLQKGKANLEARTNKGATAMQIAESLNFVGIIRVLVQYGNNGGSKVENDYDQYELGIIKAVNESDKKRNSKRVSRRRISRS